MKKTLELILIIILFSFFLILVVGIFRNGILLFGDTDLTYHFGHNFFSFKNIYLWNDYFQSGLFDFNKFQGLFLKKIIYLINTIVNNLYVFSYLWYFLTFFLYALTFYLLIKEIVKNYRPQKKFIITISLLLGLFSVLNGIFVLYAGETLFVVALIMINIFLLYFLKNINFIKEHQKNNYGYLIIMALAISEATIYLQTIFLLMYAVAIFGLLNYKFILKYFRAFSILSLLVSLIAILLNFPWIIVLFEQFIKHSASVGELVKYDVGIGWKTAESISNNIYMHELLRLKSYNVFNRIPVLFYFLGFAPIVIILIYFIKNKKRENYLFFSLMLLLLISLFLSYGIHLNTKGIYTILWEYVPFFNTFRTVMKFSFILLYTSIFLLAVILAKTKNIKIFLTYSLFIFLAALFSISYYRQPEFKRNMEQYKIPDYYFEVQARDFDNRDKKIGNNMLLPQINWHVQYEWAPKKIDSMNILPYFYGKGIFNNGPQYTPDSQYLYNDFFNLFFRGGFPKELSKLLQSRNIKYITYQDDLRFPGDETQSPTLSSRATIRGKPSLVFATQTLNKDICSFTESIGKLFFCKVDNSIFMPIFSVGGDVVIIKEQAHKDLFQETPTVLTDLAMLGIFRDDIVKFFENNTRTKEVNPLAEIYMSMRPYVTQNCYDNGLPCNIYFSEDIPEGEYYDVYFRHYPITSHLIVTDIERFMNKDYKVEIYNNVDSDYINKSIQDFASRVPAIEVQLPEKYESMEIVDYFNGDDNNYLGKIYLKGKNITIRTNNNNYWSFGRFYFIKRNNQPFAADKKNKPVIEFKKINPTKYRIIVHQAKDSFPLVFSESFHEGWKIYPSRPEMKTQKLMMEDLKDYKIFKGNEEDQVSKEMVMAFIARNWISALDKEFISKNFQGTIQNDNLSKGHIWDTWFKKSLPEENHLMANGYANSWWIDLEEIKKSGQYVENPDGSSNFELIVEFGPQRLFYLGLLISGLTLFGCCSYLVWDWRKKIIRLVRKNKQDNL